MRIRIPSSLRVTLVLIVVFTLAGIANAQLQEFVGYIDESLTSKDYLFEVQAGQSVAIIVEATSGDLDTFITLRDPYGYVLAENDDRSEESLDSEMGITAPESGIYTLTVARYEFGSSTGEYVVTINIGDTSVLEPLNVGVRIELSGAELTRDTEHFRIHYTLEGADATNETYAEATANSMELIYRLEIEVMGWPIPPSDGELGGDSRFDVYLVDIMDDDGCCALGYAVPESGLIGDNPNTEHLEERAAPSYLVIENDFSEAFEIDMVTVTPVTLMRATATHEFNHVIQFGYDMDDMHDWYYEATATWMETTALEKDEDATGYVAFNYMYPEACFGTTTDPTEGQLQYGDWLFIQMLVDGYGIGAVQRLWEKIATQEGFQPLEALLDEYETDIPTTLTRYRLKNLVRDYNLAGEFESTVWLENSISTYGQWSFTGLGVQELGANYYEFVMPPGLYQVNLMPNDSAPLNLWAIGINGNQAQAITLGEGGTISTSGYERSYLMVFNPLYDDDIEDCTFSTYSIDVQPGSGTPLPPTETWNANYFEPPIMVGTAGPLGTTSTVSTGQSNLANGSLPTS